MEAINISIKQRPIIKDWQITVQRRGYPANTSYHSRYTEAINTQHHILAQDREEFDGEPVKEVQ